MVASCIRSRFKLYARLFICSFVVRIHFFFLERTLLFRFRWLDKRCRGSASSFFACGNQQMEEHTEFKRKTEKAILQLYSSPCELWSVDLCDEICRYPSYAMPKCTCSMNMNSFIFYYVTHSHVLFSIALFRHRFSSISFGCLHRASHSCYCSLHFIFSPPKKYILQYHRFRFAKTMNIVQQHYLKHIITVAGIGFYSL